MSPEIGLPFTAAEKFLLVITPNLVGAALRLQPAPSTDLALVLGLVHIAVVDGWADDDYVDTRTTGFEAAWQRAMTWWPEWPSRSATTRPWWS